MESGAQTFGITLPITRGNRGYFNQSFTVLEQIKSNLTMLLRTVKGERRMNPEFGTGLWNILFEITSDDIGQIVDSTIRRDIARWMPYISVKSVNVSVPNSRPNELDVSIAYTVPSVGVTEQQVLQVAINTRNTL